MSLLDRLAARLLWRARQVNHPLAFQRILPWVTDLGVSDLAGQHDHYLYGTEKE